MTSGVDRREFLGKLAAELGAIRIFEVHEYTHKCLKEFGLGLRSYDTGARAFYLQGKRFLAPPAGKPWPIGQRIDGSTGSMRRKYRSVEKRIARDKHGVTVSYEDRHCRRQEIAWMNGALESAERVVTEVLTADGKGQS